MSAPDFFAQLLAFDEQLAVAGFPRLSKFWRKALKRFFASGARRLTVRAGRRAGKSLTMAKVACAWALHGDWSVSPGDVGVIPFLSIDRGEAASRLRTIAKMLDAVGARYVRRGEEIELSDRPAIFQVRTGSIGGVVGFTSILIVCDEVARWKDVETGANPAREIVASLSPTMATQPGARMFLVSSPWSTTDYHAEQFARGDDEGQRVAHAQSWIANPTLTEADTRRLEPDPRVWAREYAAIPGDAVTAVCSSAEYDACTARGTIARDPIPGASYFFANDPAARVDWWCLSVFHRELRDRDGRLDDVLVLDAVTVLKPSLFKRVTVEQGVQANVDMARLYPPAVIGSDIHLFDVFSAQMLQRGHVVTELKNTPATISARVAALAGRFASGTIDLIDDDEMRKQVLGAQLQLHQGGRMTLRAPERRGHHDDIVSTLLLGCDVETVSQLPYADGDVVVKYDEVRWDSETRSVSGGGERYYRREANGRLAPREPPYGSAAFERWAETMAAQGFSTPTIERWKREKAGARPTLRNQG